MTKIDSKGRFRSFDDIVRDYVAHCPVTGCWHWVGNSRDNGYGRACYQGKYRLAHRLFYEYYNDVKLAKNEHVCHTCDNRLCVNPQHLFLGTHQANMDDMVSKNRQARGKRHGRAKLSEEDVLDIRRLKKEGYSDRYLGPKFGVHPTTISLINTGKKWGWLNG